MKTTVLVVRGRRYDVLPIGLKLPKPPRPPKNICDWLRLEKGFRERMQKHLKKAKTISYERLQRNKDEMVGGAPSFIPLLSFSYPPNYHYQKRKRHSG